MIWPLETYLPLGPSAVSKHAADEGSDCDADEGSVCDAEGGRGGPTLNLVKLGLEA